MTVIRAFIKSETNQLILFYSIANFMLLFNDGIFIDDWAMLHNPFGVYANSIGNSRPLAAILFNFLNLFSNPALISRLVAFFTFLSSALVFRELLKRLKFIDTSDQFIFTLFYALIPLCFDSRVQGPLFLYYFCYFVFITALWLLVVSIERKNILLRILSLPLFYFSFTTKSIVFFHVVAPLFILYMHNWPRGIKDKIITLLTYTDVMIVPILFWYIHKTYYPVSQANQGYNEVSMSNIILSPYSIILSFQGTFFGLFERMWLALTESTYVLAFSALFFFILSRYVKATPFENNGDDSIIMGMRKPLFYILLGILLFILGSIPYAFVGKLPNFISSNTRLQILYQFSLTLILIGIIKLIFKRRLQHYIYIFFLSVFMSTGIYLYSYYQLWWYKTLSVINNMKKSEVFQQHTTFIIRDEVLKNSPTVKMYDPYEYNGMMKYAFGTQTRYAVNENRILDSTIFSNWMTEPDGSSIRDYQKHNFEYLVTIAPGEYRVGHLSSNFDMLRCFTLMTYRLVKPQKFREKIDNMVVLKATPINRGLFQTEE